MTLFAECWHPAQLTELHSLAPGPQDHTRPHTNEGSSGCTNRGTLGYKGGWQLGSRATPHRSPHSSLLPPPPTPHPSGLLGWLRNTVWPILDLWGEQKHAAAALVALETRRQGTVPLTFSRGAWYSASPSHPGLVYTCPVHLSLALVLGLALPNCDSLA